MNLDGKAVIVTGASSGIGRAAAIAFARAGAHVLGVGRDRDELDRTAREHPGVVPLAADLTAGDTPAAVARAAADRWGRVDVLVNNAGATAIMPLEQLDADRARGLFELNVIAPSLLARAVLPHLRRSRGSIVNVSSTYGHRPLPGGSHYAASKAALEQLTRSWALELAGSGVRVNALAPGPTESRALARAGLSESEAARVKEDEARHIPLGRRGTPEEVATWIVRLADPDSTWLTGQVLTLDGGLDLT